ncbi:glycosyltransferase family 2 protein [Bacillus carboniphilus]|uniref:Glycosyltransferase family 2 protein n=1 Tax=Bacillus carboniphilus TaxID=86663 RepID=A0ABY9JQ23_9BACI|nr:glycosyltransferase family 2 protein [Bacillus carboniphilus]WLR41500.1 glycosyltransferase family 2 protein [Bacillus carboniphilus]
MSQPLVSIITPVYNAERFIEGTIQSVLDQSYAKWELLLIDDVSTDRSRERIKPYVDKDERIKLIELQTNSGAAIARNTGIKRAAGDYVAFLDSDDMWHQKKLEKQIAYMIEHDYAFTFTSYSIIDENGEQTGKTVQAPREVDYEYLLKNTLIGCLTVVLDKRKIKKIEMVNLRTRQDLVLWLSILKTGINAYGLNESLAYYRKVPGSISSNKIKTAKQNWKVYRKIEGLPFWKALYCFVHYAYYGFKKR